jgi:predicted aspartyl protease
MSEQTMGKVIVQATIENLEDQWRVRNGLIPADQARRVEVDDSLVDTGATTLSMPKRLIAQLGLRPTRTRRARTPAGMRAVQVYETVRLNVQGRDCLSDVAELPDDCPVLIGVLSLEALDFVVDSVGQRLIGNPDHRGEQSDRPALSDRRRWGERPA